MSLLGAGNLGKNGKQQSTPTISRTGAFGTNTSNSTPAPVAPKPQFTVVPVPYKPPAGITPTYFGNTSDNTSRTRAFGTNTSNSTPAPVAPNPQPGVQPKPTNQNSIFTDIGESISHSLVNTARDIKKDPMGAVSSRLTNAVVDTVDVAANTGANLINSQAQKPVVPNVVGPKIIGNMQGADTNFNTNIQPGSLNRNPQIGTRGSGGLIVPGNGMESVNRTIGAVSLIPGLGKGVGIAGEAAIRGASSAARRAIAEPIIVNAAESDIASAAGRSIVKQTARRVKPTRGKPRSSIPPVGPMSRQLAQYAPKLELADTQPLRLANEYSAAFTDDTAANSQEIINSLYREADALAKQEKRGALVAPESYDMNSTARLTTELGRKDDLTRVAEGRWAKVYDQMVKDKTIDTDKFADADSFVNYIRGSSHTTGGTKSRITPSPEIVEANKTYLRMFHGSDEKPLNYYRTGPYGFLPDPTTGEYVVDAAAFGDYSLDKVMAGSYRPDGKYVTARVTPEQLKFPVMPIDKPTTYVDEFAQNFGEEIPSSQVKIQGRQWDDVPDFTGTASGGYESGVRGFPMDRFYELQDVDSLTSINDVSQAARDAAGLTDADIARFKEILKNRSLVAETTENADGTFSLKWAPDAIKWLNNEDIQILHKQAIARNSSFIKNKFDLDKSSGTVTGDPEGLYGVVTKRPIEGTVIRQGVPDEPIAAESDIVSAAGRPIVRQSARPPRVTPRSSSSPIGPQLAQFAPKRELANVQPIRMVTEHSRAFGDSPESNAREVIDSVYRRAQQIAESEGRQIFSTNREPQLYMKQPWNQTDLQRAAIANWSDVYDQMIKKGTLSKEEYPTSESFLDFIRSSGHIDGGSNSGPVDPTLKAANAAYLDLFHGEGASTKPISFYRNSSSGTGDPIIDASGDYSLDRTMAYNYGPKGSNGLQKTRDRIRMDVTTDSLRHPIVPLYRRDYNGEVRLDEWAQNWNNKEFKEGTDWNEGGIVEGIQPKIIGPQLEGVFPFSDAQRYREFSPATRYGVRDYEFAGELEDIPDEMFEKYGITKDDQKIWERILNRHFKPVTDEQGNTTGMALVDKRASEYGVKAGEKNPVVNPLNSKEHEVLRKVSKAMHEAGMIKEPFHYNKFDVPQLRGRGKRGVVTGDPEGFYGQIEKARQNVTIREGVSE